MRLRLIFLLVLAVCMLRTYSQTFIKRFAINSSATIAYSVLEKNNHLFVIGVKVDTSINFGINTYLAKFSLNGELLSHIQFRPQDYYSFYSGFDNSLSSTSDGGMAAVGVAVDTSGKDHILFTKFDSLGNLQYYKTYEHAFTYQHTQCHKFIELNGAFYMSGGVQLSNGYVRPILVKIDLSGNLIYIKNYSSTAYQYAGNSSSICKVDENELVLCVGRRDGNSDYWLENIKTCFISIDTNGNLLTTICPTDGNTLVERQLNQTSTHSHYLSCGGYFAKRIQGQMYPFQQEIIKWDTAFNKIWDVKIGDPYIYNSFTDFEQNAEGEIFTCGQYVCDTGVYTGFNGTICKLDSDGTKIWYKAYQITNAIASHHYLYDIDLLDNGEILAVGSWDNSSPIYNPFGINQLGWLLRLSADGCTDDGYCGLTDIAEQPEINKRLKLISIGPNPGNGIFTINALWDMPPVTTITVYDLTGRIIITQPLPGKVSLLNLNHLPNGVYAYQIGNGLQVIDAGKLVISK